MPLFHTNSLMSGFAPALVSGASLSLARRFSASRFLPDVRHYGATWFNYTGKLLTYLLATPALADDADNPLRVAFGNEGSPQVVEAAAARFGVRIIDVFGSTEGAIALDRTGNRPRGSIGRLRQGIMVVDEQGNEAARAEFDGEGRLVNADLCVGELVNTLGVGPFEGIYLYPATRRHRRTPPATASTGVGTLAMSTMTDGCISPGRTSELVARPTVRISLLRRSRPSSDAIRMSCWSTAYGVPAPDSGTVSMVALVPSGTAVRLRILCGLARRATRSQPQVAATVRPGLRRAPQHSDEQDPDSHLGTREVPFRPGAW